MDGVISELQDKLDRLQLAFIVELYDPTLCPFMLSDYIIRLRELKGDPCEYYRLFLINDPIRFLIYYSKNPSRYHTNHGYVDADLPKLKNPLFQRMVKNSSL